MTTQQAYLKRISSRPPPPDLGDPPDVIREWAEKVVQSWGLTPAEREVCDMLLKGLTDLEVAEALGRNPKTVKHQMWVIRKKAGVDSRAELFAEILRL